MRILSINTDLDESWRRQGHEVHSVALGATGVYAVPAMLESAGFEPDLVIQKEHLGVRVVLAGLEDLLAIKAFWSVDTHLNTYWQRYYGRLFDVFFTPHKAFLADSAPLHPHTHRLAACAVARPWVAHASRTQGMAFVGRLSATRLLRNRLCALLRERYGVTAQDGLDWGAMLNLYANTRLLPNESIAMETNFRLLEGASCGCCVLSQNVGDDQDCLFEPGREVLVYENALDFMAQADRAMADPALTERIGRAAWERAQREHLACHRAAEALRVLEAAPRCALQGQAGRDALFMTLGQLGASGALSAETAHRAEARLTDPCLRRQLRLMLELATPKPEPLGQSLHEAEAEAASLPPSAALADLAVVGGGAALWLNDAPRALRWLGVYERAMTGGEQAHSADADPASASLQSACASWIRALLRDGRRVTHGFQYRDGCCQSALDMILLLAERDSLGSGWAEHLLGDAHIRRIHPHLALAAQTRRSLNTPDDPEHAVEALAAMTRLFDLPQARDEYRLLLAQHPAPVWQRLLQRRFGGLA